jgi:hypothetical protein
VRLDRVYVRCQKGSDRHGISMESHELDFLGFTLSVYVYHRSNVSGFEPLALDVDLQDYPVVFVNRRGSTG